MGRRDHMTAGELPARTAAAHYVETASLARLFASTPLMFFLVLFLCTHSTSSVHVNALRAKEQLCGLVRSAAFAI